VKSIGRTLEALSLSLGVHNIVRELNPGVVDVADEGLEEIRKYEIKTRRLERMKPATTEEMVRRYEEWNERFGAL